MIKHIKILFIFSLVLINIDVKGQTTGPGGVGTTDGTSNLILWLRADYGVLDGLGMPVAYGNTVYQWQDLSGYNNHFINDYGLAPVYNYSAGRDILDFSAGSVYLRSSSIFSGTGARTVIVITQPTSLTPNTANNCVFQLAPNESNGRGYSIFLEEPGSGSGLACRVSGNRIMNHTSDITIPSIFSIQNGASETVSQTEFYVNGAPVLTQIACNNKVLNTSSLGCAIGGFSSGADNIPESIYDYNGNVSEIIVYNQELSAANRNSIETYLNRNVSQYPLWYYYSCCKP